MKRIIFSLSVLFLSVSVCIAQSDSHTTSGTTIIPIKTQQDGGTGIRPRSVQMIPITAIYSFGAVQVNFLQNIGQATITVVNNTTGEQWFEMADSAAGGVDIHISDTQGIYAIYIELESGKIYSGDFAIL